MDFVEGNESFKMVVVASKNSTGVGRKSVLENWWSQKVWVDGKAAAFFFLFKI